VKKVLFVCVENAGRSQTAKGFFNKFTTKAVADSAGIQPADHVDSKAITVMKEAGIDISTYTPKSLTVSMNNEFDYVVTMDCINGYPLTPKEKTIKWDIEDPKDKSIEKYREIGTLLKFMSKI